MRENKEVNVETVYTCNVRNKGIAHITLVIIIIILLILAGITIVQITGNRLLKKEELVAIDTIEFSYEKKEIEGTNEIQILIIIKDNESGLNKIEYPDGDILNCNGKNQIAIDYTIEKDVEYKFKIISNNGYEKEEVVYEAIPSVLYLYNQGDKCEEVTGGWVYDKGMNASVDIDSYDYFDLNSKNDYFNYAEICIRNKIDLKNYSKLKMKATVIDNGYTGPQDGTRECGYIMGLFDTTLIKNSKIYTGSYNYSTGLKQELGEEVILTFDITEKQKEENFQIAVCVTSFHVKIHQIWLE